MTKYVAKWPNAQGFIEFTSTENSTWKTLYERQMKMVQNRACLEFIAGLEEIAFTADAIPQLPAVNQKLSKTGFKMVPVGGTVQVDEFFTMLSNREFPVANFIRTPEEIDYISQPDIFHELFGHGPLLMNQTYADFIQWYGEKALTLDKKSRRIFSRLFWFTIEFGLMKTPNGTRIYGGGILSSPEETVFSLESDQPARHEFDAGKALNTPYDYTQIQKEYFVLDSLETLFQLSGSTAFNELLKQGLNGSQKSFVIC